MRDRYLFRAKRLDNGEWVEGLLTVMWGQYHIINPSDENTAYPIDTDTICQYTGFTDKNGNKIWENDVVFCSLSEKKYVVKYEFGSFGLILRPFSTLASFYGYRGTDLYISEKTLEVERIGNIFDNPELVKVNSEELEHSEELEY